MSLGQEAREPNSRERHASRSRWKKAGLRENKAQHGDRTLAHSSQHAGGEATVPESGLGVNGEARGNFKMIVTHFRI